MSTQAKEILEKHLNNCNVISRQMDREAENVQTALKLTINECARKRAQPLLDALNKIKIIAKRHGEIQDIINTAIASWKEEGKEGDHEG